MGLFRIGASFSPALAPLFSVYLAVCLSQENAAVCPLKFLYMYTRARARTHTHPHTHTHTDAHIHIYFCKDQRRALCFRRTTMVVERQVSTGLGFRV
jgi:hypothetical protein